MQELNYLTAISPIDGRYRKSVDKFGQYFSEYGLIKYRIMVEIEYFIALCEIPLPQLADFDKSKFADLREIYTNFNVQEAEKVKKIEAVTNHDVKAVEYYIKDVFKNLGIEKYQEFIHFGLTSQDINNTSVPASLRDGVEQVYYPLLEEVIGKLESLANEWKDIPMLAKTHGQPASPTLLGKEFMVFVNRLKKQYELLKAVPHTGKFGGATGNFNAHNVAYPEVNWIEFGNKFLQENLKLQREEITTQISNYDFLATLFDNIKRINTILIDLSRDVWTYVMMEYFKQKIKKGEVGSSAMPHKVNPIDFENAEGNLGISTAILEHLSNKLPISRLQRDLTDSTVLRNVGVPLSHSVISLRSILRGLDKLLLNEEALNQDLEDNWSVVAEGIQTILRREGYPNPYEALKELTRTNTAITKGSIAEFVDTLDVSDEVKEELKKITPQNYTGVRFF